MSVRIYIEGGGPSKGKNTAAKCRQAFHMFFAKFLPKRQPHIIACGGRGQTYNDFTNAHANPSYQGVAILLLVDSEALVPPNLSARQHLAERDQWKFAAHISDDQLHMMVQCMETWFMADKPALRQFYGERFLTNSLPANPNVESIDKANIAAALKHASRNTGKGEYNKRAHSFEILQIINPVHVFQASLWARRLRDSLVTYLQSI